MGSRGVIGDKWSMRVLWACAIGSAIGMSCSPFFLSRCLKYLLDCQTSKLSSSSSFSFELTLFIHYYLFRPVYGCCRETNEEQRTNVGWKSEGRIRWRRWSSLNVDTVFSLSCKISSFFWFWNSKGFILIIIIY